MCEKHFLGCFVFEAYVVRMTQVLVDRPIKWRNLSWIHLGQDLNGHPVDFEMKVAH